MSDTLLRSSDLAHFYGSESFHRLPLSRLVATEGVAWVERHGHGWLVSDIAIAVGHHPDLRGQDFLVVSYKPANREWVAEDGNETVLHRMKYDAVQPSEVDEVRFFITDGVMMLASEY